METAIAVLMSILGGAVVLATVLLLLGFLSFGVLAPIGAMVSSVTSHRRPHRQPVMTRQPVRIRHHPLPHH